MGKFSRSKGARVERLWRDVCREHGYDAERGCQLWQKGSEIADVIGLPGIHQEVKGVERLNLREAMRQSIADAAPGEIPIVAHKKNREPWLVTTTADGFFWLYREYETPKLTRVEVTVMVFALRYASNRETFAPTIVADVIISKIPLLSEQERENLTNEIMRGKKFSEYNHRALPEVERILEALAEVEDGGKDRVI